MKKLKSGYTTGSCVVASVVANLNYLIKDEILDFVDITLIDDKTLKIPINRLKKRKNFCTASVIKYSGDDPDVTNGMEIFTKVTLVDEIKPNPSMYNIDNIYITGGRGIGVITKKGLQQPIGKYAINPKPLEMIVKNIKLFLKENPIGNKKILVKIYIPKGREIAKKTFNEKLGIKGGLSILGTTGILKPMSEEALKDSLKLELKILKENNKKDWIIFSFGNYGKKYCEELGLDTENLIVISNYVGFMLDCAVELGYKKIFLVGHIGKAIKIAGGIYNTHSKVADARIEIMVTNALLVGENMENIHKILGANTVEEACDYIEKPEFFDFVANKVARKCEEYLRGEDIRCEALIFSFKDKVGISRGFKDMIEFNNID